MRTWIYKYSILSILSLLLGTTMSVKGASVIDTTLLIHQIDSVEVIAMNLYEQEFHAIQLARRSASLKQSKYGPKSAEYLQALLHLSELYAQRSMYKTAQRYHRMAYDSYMEKLRTDFCHLNESQRAMYWQTASAYFEKTMRLAHAASLNNRFDDGSKMAAAAYNAQLLSKGLLLNLSIDFERYVLNSNIPEAIRLWGQRKALLAYGESDAVDLIDDQIIAILDSCSTPYNIENLSVTWQDVRAQLKPNDLAIEFFRTTEGTYGALLLRNEWKLPKIVRLPGFISLGGKKKLSFDEVLQNLQHEMSSFRAETKWQTTAAKMVWPDNLLQYFPKPGEGTIYFSAAGILLQTAIESLPFVHYKDETNQTKTAVISDVFKMVRLSSTREIAVQTPASSITLAAVYGGISYNANINDLIVENQKYGGELLLASRGLVNDSCDRGKVHYLPGTKIEADSLHNLLLKNNISDSVYTSFSANEESFKAFSGKHCNLMHIGTHGFCWSDSLAKQQTYFRQNNSLTTNTHSDLTTIDPLSRCGLLFAGANIALSGHSRDIPDGVQDGVLTAKEISSVNLQDCELVVLSACETAKGDITSEGVFGLQRAFKMAGAKTIIMSLWPVNDEATQMLMVAFYKNWIEQKQPKHEAFKNAQNAVRYFVDEDGEPLYANPKFWACFILLD